MEDKYYTPTIEEFHIGFECEFKNNMLIPIEFRKEICEQETLSIAFDTFEHENEEFKNEFRVKYLDMKDIESLGWKYVWGDSHGTDYTFNEWQINFSLNGKSLMIFKGKATYFAGYIKNKSDLNKIMQQLNIK